jgi:hypothetical protein
MAPINPCKILDEIYQRAVFFRVVNNPPSLPPKVIADASAAAILWARDKNAYCPAGPTCDKLLYNPCKLYPLLVKLYENFYKSNLPVLTLVAASKWCYKSKAAYCACYKLLSSTIIERLLTI